MYKNLSVLAVIPARGGSKGVLNKNLRKIGGKTLVERTVDVASRSKYIDRYILSSDSDEIIGNAIKAGCDVPFKRPDHLAQDNSSTNDVLIHAMENVENYDLLVCLQVTSPLVNSDDVDSCISRCALEGVKACISSCMPSKNPYWMFKLKNGFFDPLMGREFFNKRRQDLPDVYIPNGAVAVAYADWFKENKSFYSEYTASYVMPAERSFDLDTEFDFLLVETYLQKRSNN
ncbi:MAG: hypothetical protein AB7E04_04425 [Desulfobacteraceae bacterium]